MISLADLRARDIRPSWQEAIAVLQELIQTVAATTGSAEQLPDLEHIALIPNGDVVAIPGSPPAVHPVRQAAVMLQLLLDGVPAPPELEQFVRRNLAEPPQYDSVAEFSRNLAFFERPGRRADVERLVGRAIEADQHSRADEELRRLKEKAAAATPALNAFEPETPGSTRNAQPIVIGALVLVCLLVGGAVWWWGSAGSSTASATPAGPESTGASAGADERDASAPAPGAAEPGEPVAEAAGGATPTSPVVQEVGSAGPEAADVARSPGVSVGPRPEEPPADPGFLARVQAFFRGAYESVFGADDPVMVQGADIFLDTADGGRAIRQTERAAVSAGSSGAGSRGSPGRSAPPAREATPAPSGTPLPAPAPAGNARPITAERAVLEAPATLDRALAAPTLIYSAADADVQPPAILRPVLPDSPPPGVPEDMIGTIELVINEDGSVAQARLVNPTARFQERMIVANAKTWLFRPATKDGQPVKYRTVIRLTI